MSIPESVKEIFYNTWQDPNNYKDLIIRNNSTTTKLKNIFNNNNWNLKELADDLEEKSRIEHVNFFNSWLNGVYLLDHSKTIEMKTLTVESLYNYELKDPKISETTENTYIAFYKAWINNIFPKYQNETTLDWVIKKQNHVLYKLMEYRSDNKQSLETLRKDLNLMLKLIKLSMGEQSEMANKYKSLNMGLSKILDIREKRNILSEKENRTFIEYTDLLKIRNDLYNKWENE